MHHMHFSVIYQLHNKRQFPQIASKKCGYLLHPSLFKIVFLILTLLGSLSLSVQKHVSAELDTRRLFFTNRRGKVSLFPSLILKVTQTWCGNFQCTTQTLRMDFSVEETSCVQLLYKIVAYSQTLGFFNERRGVGVI